MTHIILILALIIGGAFGRVVTIKPNSPVRNPNAPTRKVFPMSATR